MADGFEDGQEVWLDAQEGFPTEEAEAAAGEGNVDIVNAVLVAPPRGGEGQQPHAFAGLPAAQPDWVEEPGEGDANPAAAPLGLQEFVAAAERLAHNPGVVRAVVDGLRANPEHAQLLQAIAGAQAPLLLQGLLDRLEHLLRTLEQAAASAGRAMHGLMAAVQQLSRQLSIRVEFEVAAAGIAAAATYASAGEPGQPRAAHRPLNPRQLHLWSLLMCMVLRVLVEQERS
ncbi:hypothetical protein ABPG75_002698 [Micractinium tetrahymenae]